LAGTAAGHRKYSPAMPAALDLLLSSPLADAADRAAALDRAGLSGLFTYEGQGDPFFPIARAADHTSGLLYTNIAVALPRSPMHLAQQAWDLQRLSDGRFALGIGSQIKAHVERRFGSVWESPVQQMAEWIEAIRAIFATWQDGAPLAFEGRWTRHTLMPPALTPPPLEAGPPPIWAGALGPRMTEMVGRVADGVVVHPFTSRHHVLERTVPALEAGAASRDAGLAPLTRVIGAIVGLHDGTEASHRRAEAVVRGTLGFYGSTPAYRSVLDAHGWGELQPELRELTKTGRWDELGSRYDAEQVATLAIIGTPDTVADELHRRFAGIADRVALSMPDEPPIELIATLCDRYADGPGPA
jgi:probable F420-dependent oxidoreductase